MRAALIAHIRTGTSYLRSLLNTHPDAHFFTEALYPSLWEHGFFQFWVREIGQDEQAILPHQIGPAFRRYLDFLADARAERVVGLDLKIRQIDDLPVIHRVVRDSDLKIIHLVRRNTFRAHLSEHVMGKQVADGATNVHRDFTPPPTPVHMNPEELLPQLRHRVNADTRIERFYAHGDRYLKLYYEDFMDPSSRAAGLAPLFEHLGLSIQDASLDTDLKPQNPFPYKEVVVNHREVQRALKGSEFAEQLR